MKYTTKEQWIEASGVWIGLFASFGAMAIVLYQKTQIKPDTWIYGGIISIIWLAFAAYSIHKVHESEV